MNQSSSAANRCQTDLVCRWLTELLQASNLSQQLLGKLIGNGLVVVAEGEMVATNHASRLLRYQGHLPEIRQD
jgi:hypothetical protein